MKLKQSFADKKLIVFDMDGTLTPSKSVADREMAGLLLKLLEVKQIAVIGGGKYSLFKEQLLGRLPRRDARLKTLFLFPTTANAFYHYKNGWDNVYTLSLAKREKTKIRKSLREVFDVIGYVHPKKVYGATLEDRGTQMSFSPLGQDIVAALGKRGIFLKEKWKKENNPLRFKIAKLLQKKLPHLNVRVGGITTIDITCKGIDKAYGMKQIKKYLHMPIKDILFIGDAIFPGGNDYAVRKAGVDYIQVSGPEETKKIIRFLIGK